MRRALAGLVLFGCLAASGWAWLAVTTPVDVTGAYVRIVNAANAPEVCAATQDVPPWGMRVEEAQVIFANEVCQIANRSDEITDTAEGPYTTVVLDLICGGDPAGPEGQSATLHITHWAELTRYLPAGDSFIPAHATFRSCATLPNNGS